MRLYARCMRVYQALHPALIDEMHYKTFFGLCREAIVQQEEEDAEYERKYGKNHRVVDQDPVYVRQQFNGDTAIQYRGPVVRKDEKVDRPPERG